MDIEQIRKADEATKMYRKIQDIFLTVKDAQYSVHYPDPLRAILDPLRAAAEKAAQQAFDHQEALHRDTLIILTEVTRQ